MSHIYFKHEQQEESHCLLISVHQNWAIIGETTLSGDVSDCAESNEQPPSFEWFICSLDTWQVSAENHTVFSTRKEAILMGTNRLLCPTRQIEPVPHSVRICVQEAIRTDEEDIG